jgi:hypothetical protein
MSKDDSNHGNVKRFAGEDEDGKAYERWKTWAKNKMSIAKDLKSEQKGPWIHTLLDGKALESIEHLPFEAYFKEEGDVVLWTLLDKRFPVKDRTDEMVDVLTEVFRLTAAPEETVKAWTSRARETLEKCKRKSGVDFPTEARGWIVLHCCGMTEEQIAIVKSRTQGSLKMDKVCEAFYSCFPNFKAKKHLIRGAMLAEVAVSDAAPYDSFDDPLGGSGNPFGSSGFEDVEALLAEHGGSEEAGDEIFEEGDVIEILAVSWKERRGEINKLQKSRKFDQAQDVKRSFRIEVEELKKKTKCHKCGKIGHWSRECRSAGPGKGLGKGSSSSGVKPTGAAFVANFVYLAQSQTMVQRLAAWRQQAELEVEEAEPATEIEVHLVSSPGMGVLDSGCGKSLIGRETLEEFKKLWAEKGIPLPDLEPEKSLFCFGNGQREVSTHMVRAPIGLNGNNGTIKVASTRRVSTQLA